MLQPRLASISNSRPAFLFDLAPSVTPPDLPRPRTAKARAFPRQLLFASLLPRRLRRLRSPSPHFRPSHWFTVRRDTVQLLRLPRGHTRSAGSPCRANPLSRGLGALSLVPSLGHLFNLPFTPRRRLHDHVSHVANTISDVYLVRLFFPTTPLKTKHHVFVRRLSVRSPVKAVFHVRAVHVHVSTGNGFGNRR